MEFKDVLDQRKSIRHFTDQKIDRKDLEEIIRQAQKVPTWVNSQPYKVYIATGKTLEDIKVHHRKQVEDEVPANPNWEPMSRELWEDKGRLNMDQWTKKAFAYFNNDLTKFQEANTDLFNCQAAVYLALPKNAFKYSIYDLGGFGLAITLAARDMGIDSIVAFEYVKYPDYLDKVLDVDKDFEIVMGIGLGYRDYDDEINKMERSREPLENLLTIKD